jgi:hypothetical protein
MPKNKDKTKVKEKGEKGRALKKQKGGAIKKLKHKKG